MINLATISNMSSRSLVGYLGIDVASGEVGFFVNDDELHDILNYIVQESLAQDILENNNDIVLEHSIKVTSKNGQYITALNYHLPFPWRITEVVIKNEDLTKALENLHAKWLV